MNKIILSLAAIAALYVIESSSQKIIVSLLFSKEKLPERVQITPDNI